MQDHQFSEDIINDVILKYADESFSVRDVVKFEVLLKYNPEYSHAARVNRKVRLLMQSLPRMKASVGFERRLAERIANESRSDSP
ncbi:MAG: hypothetical protein WEC12_00865 [Balneolaceae bacterium]